MGKGEPVKKKPHLDFSAVRLEIFTEGLCCQVMHKGIVRRGTSDDRKAGSIHLGTRVSA